MNDRQSGLEVKQLVISHALRCGATRLTIGVALFIAAALVGLNRLQAADDADKKESASADSKASAPVDAKKSNPFADEQATKEKPAITSDTKPAAKADTKPDVKPDPKPAEDDPFKSTPAKGKDDKNDAKGPGDLLNIPTMKKKDDAKPAPTDTFPDFSIPDKKGDAAPNLLPGADKPADAKPPADAKTPEKTPRSPADLLSDTKSTDEPQTPGQAELKHGQELLDAGKYKEALDPLKKAAKLAPTEAGPHYSLGVAYRMLNQFDEAIEEFSEALKIDSALTDAFLRRGVCWYYKNEYALAQADFEDASGGSTNDPRPLTWKGMTLVRLGLMRDAVNVYSEALRYDNHYAPAHVNRGLAYITLKEYDKAIADFDQAIRSTPKDGSLYFKRGVAQGGLNDWPAAVRSYSEAIRLNPKNGDAYRNRSLAYRRIGDAEKAQADYEKAQQLKTASDRNGQSAVR